MRTLGRASQEVRRQVERGRGTLLLRPRPNFYTHAIPDTHRRAIESLEEALFPVVPKCSQVGDGAKEAKVVIH